VATHDYVIANGTGAAVRSDLNGALAAIVSNNSSATAPSTTYAYQWWADTTTGLLKIRNSANSAWVTLFELDGTLVASDISLGVGTEGAPSLFFTGDVNTGLFSPGADTVALVTGGTARAHITSAGNVGIGTNSPSAKAEIASSGSESSLILRNTSSTPSTYSELKFAPFTGTTAASAAIRAEFYGNNFSSLAFRTTNIASEPATGFFIDGGGYVGIGTTAPTYQLQLSTDSAGKPSTSTWTIVSDERIKEDIELADLDLCYEAIKAIPLKRYKWRDEIYTAEQVTDRRKLGWIAQDVEAIFPKAVGTHEFKYNQIFEETIIPAVEEELDADGNVITAAQPERTERGDLISEDVIEDCRNLNSDQIYAAMYGAIQKLMAKVEALETSNADLIARVAALEAA
jgi:hypothetical protein